MTFDEWYEYGRSNNYCGEMYCMSHGYPELSDEEESELDEWGELCVTLIRLDPPTT